MIANLFADLPAAPERDERLTTLLQRPGLKIERIVSTGQSSPPGFWYDCDEAEWVVLLSGHAQLRFADEAQARTLRAGDFVDIAPHRRHRVEATSQDEPAVWLAIHYADEAG